MSDDDRDPEDIQREALATAADRSHYFEGKKLEPFSFGRQTAAQRIDMSGDSALESAVMLIYLCTLGEGIVTGTRETGLDRIDKARGEDGVRKFRAQMNEWADERGIKFGSSVALEIKGIADAIWADVFRSETVPDAKGGGSGTKKRRP